MTEALKEAKKAYTIKEIPVGCVIVDENNNIIGKGFNMKETNKNPLDHAELIAIEEAVKFKKDWRLTGCSIYITAEPCMMCSGAIFHSRISNLIYGTKMEKFGNIESLIDINNVKLNHKINITSRILEDECKTILKEFFKKIRRS